MERTQKFFQALADRMDLPVEPLPGQPVAEVWGEKRVLVENHQGILSYSQEEILIRVSYGSIRVYGQHMELSYMTGDQLIITGEISGLSLQRRGLC